MSQFTTGGAALCLLALLAGCGGQEPPAPQEQTVEVAPLVVAPRAQAIMADLPGRISPVRVAEVRARVAGIVRKRHFEEGATVKEGDLLFTIEPAPFEAALARAQGALARAEAQARQAQALVDRYAPLVRIEAVSRQEYDDAAAALQTAKANRVSAQAEVKTAQLDLGYASVRAPISGRIGRGLVTEGSLVGQGESTPMALIQQIDPVYADFRQPINAVLKLREAAEAGQVRAGGAVESEVGIRVDGTGYTARGRLLFSDVSVDPGTGQVLLRAEFPNPDGLLLPGMYVRVSAEQGVDRQAIFVPQRAVMRGPDGQARVLVVSAEGRAQERVVQTGAMQGAQWQITQGLAAGDQVVVDGAAKIAPGTPLHVRQQDAQAPAQTPSR
ncbi:efflux RND transporter periplasmic adaptor subunit [Achromobacter xylosoxidans]|uniref:efflux RND transporter periplasmic adaptor subunit n=1 Tax=Alcaligenes xylosoxydans xylosoxydans TaxID=85698 RepID=UPI0022B8F617|nr:efflux RND transporter periplasmic adaptor subunit [Achromobacter xylosoxidans]MCZ8389567.1 efflux RND transporter periplasmic adaptor subunit [Achromobacter xylosoxidans]